MSYYNQDLLLKLENENTILKAKLAEIEKQEPAAFMKFDANGEFVTCRLNHKGMVFDCDASYRAFYASQVQQSPAVAQQRIAEQDAREIIGAYDNSPTYGHWLESDAGKFVLAKLNEHREPDYKAKLVALLEGLEVVGVENFIAQFHDGEAYRLVGADVAEQAKEVVGYKTQRDLLLAAMKNYLLDIGSKENEPVQEHIQRSYKLIAAMHHAIAQCEGENNTPPPTEDAAGILIRPQIKLE